MEGQRKKWVRELGVAVAAGYPSEGKTPGPTRYSPLPERDEK
ncbi:hypothetical protein ACWGCP_24000 [Streptomyces niveus]